MSARATVPEMPKRGKKGIDQRTKGCVKVGDGMVEVLSKPSAGGSVHREYRRGGCTYGIGIFTLQLMYRS